MVNFPPRILDCDSHSPAFLDLFLSSDASICSTMAFPPLGNSDYVVVSVSIDFWQWDAPFHFSAFFRFSAACAAAIVHRNHFFNLCQREKPSDSKLKFRQASNHWKRILEAAKLAYANETKESVTSQRLGSCDFWRIANSALNRGELLYLLYSTAWRCCLLHLIKQNW